MNFFAYVDEFIDDQWDRYQQFIDDNDLTDSEQTRYDFIDLRIDDYSTFIKELSEAEYTGDEGNLEDTNIYEAN